MADINKNAKQNLTDINNDLDIFLPREINDEERSALFEKYWQIINTGSPKQEDVFYVLYNYFNENEFSRHIIEKFYDTYWFIFVKISWRILSRLRMNYAVEIVARTLPFAVAEYIDVKLKFSEILILYNDDDAKLFYAQIKQKLLSLDYPVSFNEYGKNITISQFVKKINEWEAEQDLSRFSMFANIQKALFYDIPDENELAKKDALRRTMEFIEMMYFFVKDSDVTAFKDAYFDKLNNQSGSKISKGIKEELGAKLLVEYFTGEKSNQSLGINLVKESARSELTDNKKLTRSDLFVEELLKHKKNFTAWIQESSTLRSLLTWLNSFEDKHYARAELSGLLARELGAAALADMETALAVASVDEFLNKNNYPGDDLIHFDEKAGGFKWGA